MIPMTLILLFIWRFHRAAGLALVLLAGACTGSCTSTGSSCTTDDGCPPGLSCDAGRCEPEPDLRPGDIDEEGYRARRRPQEPPPIS